MVVSSLLHNAIEFATSLLSYRSKTPILVIESDDWGSIRMSSLEAYRQLEKKYPSIDQNTYLQHDGLESNDDVRFLAEVLSKVKSNLGRPACVTLNYLSANPDFKAIRENKFEKYIRKPIQECYEADSDTGLIMDLVKQGIDAKLFEVEFHGTEHLQVNRWMNALNNGNNKVKDFFDFDVFSPPVAEELRYSMEYMDAMDYDSINEIPKQLDSLSVGLELFERNWGKTPTSFIAPCYRWSKPIEQFLSSQGVRYIQGQRAQLHPRDEVGYKQRKIYHYTGQANEFGQIYTVRNVFFEPSIHGEKKALEMAKSQIQLAYKYGVPAIVSSHRINYTSRINIKNRDTGLKALNELLNWIIEEYNDVEFMSSSELGKLIENNRS